MINVYKQVLVCSLNPRNLIFTNINRSISEDSKKITEIDNETTQTLHKSVLMTEVMKHLVDEVPHFKNYIDMTFGAGGHTREILDRNPGSRVFALDRDPMAFNLAQKFKSNYLERIVPMNGKFSDMENLLIQNNMEENSVDGVLIDAGVSSMQFDTAERGFSISCDGPLDMRMASNRESDAVTAADLVNRLDEKSLSKIIWKYGEERMHKKIAHGIVFFRSAHGKIETTKQLADIIYTTIGNSRSDSLNRPTSAATKTFQALRIFVNNELNELHNGISQARKFLKPGGRIAVISFHSLEDRIVKNHFNDIDIIQFAQGIGEEGHRSKLSSKQYSDIKFKMNNPSNFESKKQAIKRTWTTLNKKVIIPSDTEIEQNPRARSAKLRIAIKN